MILWSWNRAALLTQIKVIDLSVHPRRTLLLKALTDASKRPDE